jgi:hypothetical protein
MLHHRLPVSFSSISLWHDQSDYSSILNSPSLLESQKSWDIVARTWLETNGPETNVGTVVDGYATRTHDFDSWLREKVADRYSAELAEFEVARRAFSELYSQTFGF